MTDKVQSLYGKLPRKSFRVAAAFALAVFFMVVYPVVLGSGHHLVAELSLIHI